MKFTPLARLPDVLLVEPAVFKDDRGYFYESHHQQKFAEGGIAAAFVQDNQSFSVKNTLRGLHAQLRRPQGKLVRAVLGEVFDVAVDIRPGSATFGQWDGAVLSGENFCQLYIPPGFAHGFSVLSDTAHVLYKCTDLYDRDDEIGIVWNDPDLGIDWRVTEPVLSPKDAALPRLSELASLLGAASRAG